MDKGCDAPSWRELNENKTIGAYMSMAGYRTGFFGESFSRLACLWLGTRLSMSMSEDRAIHMQSMSVAGDEAIHRACLWLGMRLFTKYVYGWGRGYPQSMSMAGDEGYSQSMPMAGDEAIHRVCLCLGTRAIHRAYLAGDEDYPQSMSVAGDEAIHYNYVYLYCLSSSGKYLNNYGFQSTGVNISHIPPGWTRWYTLEGDR